MSDLFTSPNKANEQTVLRSVFRNRKLADTLLKAIYNLQVFVIANGGTIVKSISDVTVSTQTAYTVNIQKQLTKALNNDYLAGRILNIVRELQVLAGITPITDTATSYKTNPYQGTIQKVLISCLANKRIGKLLQEAIYELQVQFGTILDITEVKASFNGSVTKVIPAVPAVAAGFTGQVAGMTTDITISADVTGVAGNITLVADSVSTIAELIAAHNLAGDPDEQITLDSGVDTQVPTADIVLTGGTDEIAEHDGSFTLTLVSTLAGAAGNKTVTGNGTDTCATLIGAGYTISAGGTEIPKSGVSIAIAGGVTAADTSVTNDLFI